MKIQLFASENHSLCTMKGCQSSSKNEMDTIQYLEISATFNHVDETFYNEMKEDEMKVINTEAKFWSLNDTKVNVAETLSKGELVRFIETSGRFTLVFYNGKTGWILTDSLASKKEIGHKLTLLGETHHAVICSDCLPKLQWKMFTNWETFYMNEIEEKQTSHVVSNYNLEYMEAFLAYEGRTEDKVDSDLLKQRILKEIDSDRFNQEKILEHFIQKRA